MIATKKPKEYDAAVELLADIKALSERDGQTAAFSQTNPAAAQGARPQSRACSTTSTAFSWLTGRHMLRIDQGQEIVNPGRGS